MVLVGLDWSIKWQICARQFEMTLVRSASWVSVNSFPVARFEPTLLKPRSARGGDERKARPTRPSMLMRHSPSLIAIAIPTILISIAVYIALVFATRITGTILKQGADEPGDPEIRPVETTKMLPFVEQTPPPSPEVVAERVRQELEAGRESLRDAPFPILELETDPETATSNTVPVEPLPLPPPEIPQLSRLLPNGTTPSDSAEAK